MIPNELVEETWNEMGSGTPARLRELMDRMGKSQGNLLSFVHVFTEELDPEAHGLALYMFAVIYLVFEKASGCRIRRVRQAEIKSAYDRTDRFFSKYIGAHERFLENAAKSLSSSQPFVVKYLVDALLEAPEQGEDDVDLSDEDCGRIFMVLITVIDLLDGATSPRKS